MMTAPCLFYVLSVIISVTSNPIAQPFNVCPPTSYSNPTAPVVIQPSSSSLYPQGPTVQVPATYPGPLGETLNQIVLNRILSNPSLQKIIDPNTKLYNQNGDEVQRQVQNTGAPNVINNYFIVPPEFFSLNETAAKNEEGVAEIDQASKRPHRRKPKRRLKKVKEETSGHDEEIETKPKRKRKPIEYKNEFKRKRVNDEIESVESIDERDASHEITIRDQESKRKPKLRPRKKKKEEIAPTPVESIEDDSNELEDRSSDVFIGEEKIKTPRKSKTKLNSKHIDEESHEIMFVEPEQPTEKRKTVLRDKVKEESVIKIPKKRKKHKRPESFVKISEDKTLKNIELPTDVSNRVTEEKRPTRDSNRNAAKKVPEQKHSNIVKKEPLPNVAPFPDDVLKNFFPYMPMGSFDNPYSNYPTGFDHYYRYLDPVRHSNANRNKKKPKNQNIQNGKSNGEKTNTHTIEIKLKPKNKENTTAPLVTTQTSDTTETPVTTEISVTSVITETPVTTEAPTTTAKPKYVHEITLSVEDEQNTESIEEITVIPMEMPQKVSPVIEYDEESSSKESYETFSKLEDLHDFITPELGTEDEVHPICDNGIFNEYYPVFHDDVYYNPDAERVNHLDDRYFYKTGHEDTIDRERRKLDRYEDTRDSKLDNDRYLESTESKNRKHDRDINKFNYNEYLDHTSTFSETDSLDNEKVKPNDEIRRVKVPSKNTRAKTESVETVFAGSKVAKYGVPVDAINYSSAPTDESSSSERTSYVFAKSIGHPEDYW